MNPYLSKQDLIDQRSEVAETLKQSFSNRVQETISEALKSLSKDLRDEMDIRVDLSKESLSWGLYNSILEKHCNHLRELGYLAHISHLRMLEKCAFIHLNLSDD